jgi:hypothetical protein
VICYKIQAPPKLDLHSAEKIVNHGQFLMRNQELLPNEERSLLSGRKNSATGGRMSILQVKKMKSTNTMLNPLNNL